MLRCPINNLLVKIEKEYSDELVFKNGTKLHIDPSWNPNFHATITGRVVSTPRVLKNGRPEFEVGDEVIFSYKVVGDTTFENDPKAFRKIKGDGYLMEWQNSEGEGLQMQLVSPNKKLWGAAYTDKQGELIEGKAGSQGECEAWIATNFKFTSSQGFKYDHKIEYEGEEYWKVDANFVFSIKRGKKWEMVGEYVMLEPLVEKKPELMTSGLVRTDSQQVEVREDKGWVRYISKVDKWLGLLPGDVALFDKGMKEQYNVDGQPMYIVRQRFIFAKE